MEIPLLGDFNIPDFNAQGTDCISVIGHDLNYFTDTLGLISCNKNMDISASTLDLVFSSNCKTQVERTDSLLSSSDLYYPPLLIQFPTTKKFYVSHSSNEMDTRKNFPKADFLALCHHLKYQAWNEITSSSDPDEGVQIFHRKLCISRYYKT